MYIAMAVRSEQLGFPSVFATARVLYAVNLL